MTLSLDDMEIDKGPVDPHIVQEFVRAFLTNIGLSLRQIFGNLFVKLCRGKYESFWQRFWNVLSCLWASLVHGAKKL